MGGGISAVYPSQRRTTMDMNRAWIYRGLMVNCQIHDWQSLITRMECGVGPYVRVLESGLGMVSKME